MIPFHKKSIKLYFEDFWPGFNHYDNIFYKLLSNEFDIEITDITPDVLIHSAFGKNFLKYNCLRIFFSGENLRSDFYFIDYSISFDFLNNDNHLRFPLYYLYIKESHLRYGTEEVLKNKNGFCSFVVSNPHCTIRNNFFHKLSKYKKVDSGGKVFNNTGSLVKNKYEFLKNYKFNIAFENSSYPGYTSEKIYDAFASSAIPIYWGNKLIKEDFESGSFVNYYDFKSENELIDFIIFLDENDDKYIEMYKKFDFDELKNKRKKITKSLETFLVNATYQYIDKGITNKRIDKMNDFEKYVLKKRYYLNEKHDYYWNIIKHYKTILLNNISNRSNKNV